MLSIEISSKVTGLAKNWSSLAKRRRVSAANEVEVWEFGKLPIHIRLISADEVPISRERIDTGTRSWRDMKWARMFSRFVQVSAIPMPRQRSARAEKSENFRMHQ